MTRKYFDVFSLLRYDALYCYQKTDNKIFINFSTNMPTYTFSHPRWLELSSTLLCESHISRWKCLVGKCSVKFGVCRNSVLWYVCWLQCEFVIMI